MNSQIVRTQSIRVSVLALFFLLGACASNAEKEASDIDKIPSGGYILADNVLWGGKVMDEKGYDATTRAIHLFNRTITEDSRTENLLLPIRDGIMVIKKI